MANAMMKLLSIISQNGALLTPTPFTQMVFMFSSRWLPGISVIGVSNTDLLSSVAATKATYSGNKMTAIPEDQHGVAENRQPATVLNHW